MEYQKYIEQAKSRILNLTKIQKVIIAAVIILLIGVGVYLINPKKKLLEMRNSQRRSDVVNILNAVYQYSADQEGKLPFPIPSEPTMICRTKASSCEGLVDISEVIATEKKILSEVPVDSSEKNPNIAGYQIYKSANGRINVTAPLAENRAVISLSK